MLPDPYTPEQFVCLLVQAQPVYLEAHLQHNKQFGQFRMLDNMPEVNMAKVRYQDMYSRFGKVQQAASLEDAIDHAA